MEKNSRKVGKNKEIREGEYGFEMFFLSNLEKYSTDSMAIIKKNKKKTVYMKNNS